MSNSEGTTAALESATPQHPRWCNAHIAFDDDSSDWHQSARQEIAGHWFYVSTGTVSGEAELFMDDREGLPLDDAIELATRLLLVVQEAAR